MFKNQDLSVNAYTVYCTVLYTVHCPVLVNNSCLKHIHPKDDRMENSITGSRTRHNQR